MSALSSLTQTSGTSTTTLPAWYDTAQQNLVKSATAAAGAAPQLGQTVAQGAINTLSGPNNPFTQATNTLGNISAGAANPWITDPTTGAVTPNTSTAMGGLFQAQNQQLNQLMPTTLAPTEANAIGSGNFGSMRADSALDTAKGNAFANLATQQNQAALQNQQTGATAAANQGNVAQQGIINAMNVGQSQTTAPFTSTANLGNILGSVQAPTTVNTSQTPSQLSGLTGLGAATAGGLNALFASGVSGTSGYNPGMINNLTKIGSGANSIGNDIKTWWNGSSLPAGTGTNPGNATTDYATSGGGTAANTLTYDPNSPTGYVNNSGQVVDGNGVVIGQDAGSIGGTTYNPSQNYDAYGNPI